MVEQIDTFLTDWPFEITVGSKQWFGTLCCGFKVNSNDFTVRITQNGMSRCVDLVCELLRGHDARLDIMIRWCASGQYTHVSFPSSAVQNDAWQYQTGGCWPFTEKSHQDHLTLCLCPSCKKMRNFWVSWLRYSYFLLALQYISIYLCLNSE